MFVQQRGVNQRLRFLSLLRSLLVLLNHNTEDDNETDQYTHSADDEPRNVIRGLRSRRDGGRDSGLGSRGKSGLGSRSGSGGKSSGRKSRRLSCRRLSSGRLSCRRLSCRRFSRRLSSRRLSSGRLSSRGLSGRLSRRRLSCRRLSCRRLSCRRFSRGESRSNSGRLRRDKALQQRKLIILIII